MNIDYGSKKCDSNQKLNESQNVDISPTEFADINSTESNGLDSMVENYQKLFKNDSNLFRFSNGVKMARIDANVNVDSRFSLLWHANNATDLDDFLNSVANFVKAELTESEKTQLTRMYNQLYPEF